MIHRFLPQHKKAVLLRGCYTVVFVCPLRIREVGVFFSVRDLEVRKAHFDVAISPGEIDYVEGLRQIGPLEAEGTAELLGNTLGEIRVKGRLKVAMEADCDRCLEKAGFPIDAAFDLFYRPAETSPGGDEVAISDGESEIGFYSGGGVDLKEILREYILLSLPMQRVCRESCLGICPVCGQNRNLRACECSAAPVDDRWAALRNLKN